MKIIFIGCRDITLIGGIENYMYNLTRQLTNLGYSCVVYCESDANRHFFSNGVEIYHWKSFSTNLLTKPLLSIKSTIHALIHHKDATVFHYNTWAAAMFCWLPRIAKKTVVLQGHGFEWKRTKYSPSEQKIHHIMEKITAKMAQHLIMVSEEQTLYYIKNYHRTPTTIPCAVNPPPPIDIETSNQYLNKYGLTANKYFFFLGRLVKDKNPLVLIKAFKEFCSKYDYKLCISGNLVPDTEYAKQIMEEVLDNPDIVMTGAVYNEEKWALLQNCGCFCLPSSMEGLPISLLEAMVAKVPIICSYIPACVEAVKENGLFVTPEDVTSLGKAMMQHLEGRYDQIKFVEANKQRAEEFFSWNSIAGKYRDYIEAITSESRVNRGNYADAIVNFFSKIL